MTHDNSESPNTPARCDNTGAPPNAALLLQPDKLLHAASIPCPAGGAHEPFVFPEGCQSPSSDSPDVVISFRTGRGNKNTEGFMMDISVCAKCGTLYVSKYAPPHALMAKAQAAAEAKANEG